MKVLAVTAVKPEWFSNALNLFSTCQNQYCLSFPPSYCTKCGCRMHAPWSSEYSSKVTSQNQLKI